MTASPANREWYRARLIAVEQRQRLGLHNLPRAASTDRATAMGKGGAHTSWRRKPQSPRQNGAALRPNRRTFPDNKRAYWRARDIPKSPIAASLNQPRETTPRRPRWRRYGPLR